MVKQTGLVRLIHWSEIHVKPPARADFIEWVEFEEEGEQCLEAEWRSVFTERKIEKANIEGDNNSIANVQESPASKYIIYCNKINKITKIK